MPQENHLGFYKHDYLPHFDAAGLIQFVTFVMADAAPSGRLRTGMRMMNRDGELMFFQMDSDLDRNTGSCLLASEWVAEIVAKEILTLGEMLLAWVVMPNHVHLLYRQSPGESLGKTIQRIKSRSSMLINRRQGRQGNFWQSGYFDRCMRDIEHVQRPIEYIHYNPVKAGLVNQAGNWNKSSFRTFDKKEAMQVVERTFIGVEGNSKNTPDCHQASDYNLPMPDLSRQPINVLCLWQPRSELLEYLKIKGDPTGPPCENIIVCHLTLLHE